VCFRIGDDAEPFYVHQDLLDAHGFDNSDEHPEGPLDLDEDGRYLWYIAMHPCIFRGFLHWLYGQELPTEEMIQSLDYPPTWNVADEVRPLACVMAIALYFLGHSFQMISLQRVTLAYLFDYYKGQRKVPSLEVARLSIYGSQVQHIEGSVLRRLCVDLYAKWYGQNAPDQDFWKSYDKLRELPPDFVEQVFKRRTTLSTTGRPASPRMSST
jgi:hypothetical protein